MRKDELRKLRALNVTPGMLTAAKKQEKHDIFVRAQCLGGILKIAFFKPSWIKRGIKTPRCETFINQVGSEWLSRVLDVKGKEEAWSRAMVFNLPCLNLSWWSSFDIWITADAFGALRRLDRAKKYKKSECLDALWHWQLKIREENIQEAEKREQKPWDEEMKLIPKIPEKLSEWMHRKCNDEFWLIYEYKKGQKMAYCSRCHQTVEVKGLKNGAHKKCPACGAECKCNPAGRLMQRQYTGWYHGRVIQKIKGGIVERKFTQRESYRGKNYKNPAVVLEEDERIIIPETGKPRRYVWSLYKNKYRRWCLDKGWIPENFKTYGMDHAAKNYPPTLKEAGKSPIMQKSSYSLWPKECRVLTLAEYLVVEQGNPAVEKLAKIGMFEMASEMIRMHYDKDLLSESETELAKMLKIDGQRLKRLRMRPESGITALMWMQREKKQNTIWPDDMISDFDKNKLQPKILNYLPHKAMTEIQVWNYLKKQSAIIGEDMGQAFTTWNDYLNMAESMKMDVRNSRILRPKNVRIAHDELVILKNTNGMEKEAKGIEKKFPKVNGNLPKLAKFEFKDKKYCIIAPKAVLDIVREGRILQHCVHTCEYYFSRISTDESYLFFLRRMDHPDMPWYTLEVEPSGNIRQKRTTGDRQNKDFDDAVDFLKKWQQHFKKQLTKEEKKLGIKADELRKKNYRELREQAKKVWHGPLAGQLLADVLEADFMEAL